jgi:hypothetical protein
MKTYRDDILHWPRERQAEWHERAAIRQYDGGQPRAKAEFEAYREIKRDMERAI